MGLNCRAENLGKCPLLGLGSWLLALDIITMTPTERQNPSECTQSPLHRTGNFARRSTRNTNRPTFWDNSIFSSNQVLLRTVTECGTAVGSRHSDPIRTHRPLLPPYLAWLHVTVRSELIFFPFSIFIVLPFSPPSLLGCLFPFKGIPS